MVPSSLPGRLQAYRAPDVQVKRLARHASQGSYSDPKQHTELACPHDSEMRWTALDCSEAPNATHKRRRQDIRER